MQRDNKVPSNIDELQRRIEQDFRAKYKEKQSTQLATNITQYFIYHQFDEWQDIANDINNGYDDCCCKQILFKQLNITNIKQKQNEYLRLKQCLNPPIFAQIFQDISNEFSIIFNAEIADIILKLFNNIINEEGFDDIDNIKADVDEIESSQIISYIIDEIDFNEIDSNKEEAQMRIANGIQLICNGNTNHVIQQYGISLTDKVKHQIANVFIHKFKQHAVTQIIVSNTFNHMINKDQLYNPRIIIDDLKNSNKSEILHNIFKVTSISQENGEWIARTISNIIDGQLIERKRFDITQNFTFKTNVSLITDIMNEMKEHCSIIYEHADDMKNNEQDKSLIIAKSLDIINKYPLLMWFINLFGRDRIKGHKENYAKNLSYHKDRFAINYDVQKWWTNDSKLCKYITTYYDETASVMIEGIKLLTKRILPPLNFHHALANTICDSLNDFAKYTLSSHSFARKIIEAMSNNQQFQFAPVQFDVWIIPQATAPSIRDQPSVFELEQNGITINRGNRVYNEMGKHGSFGKAQNAFWNLETYLKKDQYVKNKDYIVQEVNNDLDLQMFSMFNSKTLNLTQKRENRYIFIIDRRNPENMQHKNMGYIEPKIDIPDKNGNINNPTKTWKDRIYFVKPKVEYKLTSKCEVFPEQCLGLSAKYLFPNPESIDKSNPIKILDALNGYKFALSYHLFSDNNCSTYWYINHGSIKFELQDMKWIWCRYFDKINNRNQELCEKIANDIDKFNIYKQVRSKDFDEFMSQSECELQPPLKSQDIDSRMKIKVDGNEYEKLKIEIKYKEEMDDLKKTIKALKQQLLEKEEKHKQGIKDLIERHNDELETLRKILINMNQKSNENKQEIENLRQRDQMNQAIMYNENVYFK